MSVYKFNISKLFTKISLVIFFLLTFFSSTTVFAQFDGIEKKLTIKKNIPDFNKAQKHDTINKNSTVQSDSTQIAKDSLVKSTLEDLLYHYAEDYTEVNEKKKFIKLYNKAHIKYQDIDLTAGVIYVDYEKKEVYAGRIPDSTGVLTQRPVFKQGNTETENDSIRFNFETKKALVWNTYTTEGEFSMQSELTKKYNDSIIFVKNIKFTTSTDKEHPEYYFLAKKAKIVPNKKIVVGTTQMWIEDVATPLIIPFGFFPLTETRKSGILMPTFADTRYGYSLSEGGFYWAINQYFDLTTTGDIYTNGSYGLKLRSNYKKRYKYKGSLSFSYQNQITSSIGLPDYSKATNWKLIWNHSRDGKSNPLSNFSAKVDFGSSKYYRDSYSYTDVLNTNNRLSNEIGSSISYQRKMAKLPVNYSITLNHNQNVNTETINLTLPQFYLNVNKIYPFSKNGVKKNALQKINFTYRFDAKNQITTSDSLLFTDKMWDGSKTGAKHTIPINTNMKLFKYFNFQPQINYTEVWALQTIRKSWDPEANDGAGAEIINEVNGFESFRNISTSASLSTTLYGTYLFGKDKFIKGIRHTITTSLSAGYTPIFDQFIKEYYDSTHDEYVQYTIFDNSIYGRPNILESESLRLSVNNTFEAKIRKKEGKDKKIRFLNISTGYDFLRDSLKVDKPRLTSTANISTGLKINLSAIFDPYALDSIGRNIDAAAFSKNQGIGRIQNFSLSTGYNFSNDTFKKNKGNGENNNNKKGKNKSQEIPAYNNSIKWNARVSYTFSYRNKAYSPLTTDFREISTHSLTFTGKVSFSPSWQVSYRSGYDFVNNGFTYTQLSFYRDLKSWKMSFTWNPIEPSYWFFNISIKSSMLQGIKYDKRKEPLKLF